MLIVVNPAIVRHQLIQRALARMAKRRMAEVVGQTDALDKILVCPKRSGDRAPNLGNFERMGDAGPIVVPLGDDEDLGLALQPPPRRRMQHAFAVTLEGGPIRLLRVGVRPPARFGAAAGKRRKGQRLQAFQFFSGAHAWIVRFAGIFWE